MGNKSESPNYSISVSEDLIAWNINTKESLYYLPAGIFVICLLIIGLPGNFLVVYIYHFHFKKSTATMYIKVLGILDSVCCLFGMTFEIVDMFFPLLNGEPITCKVLRTVEQTMEYISAELLLLIAYDRYLHICRPLEVFTFNKARRLVIFAVVAGIVLSAPTSVLIGRANIEISGITFHACSLDSALGHKGTTFAFVYYLTINVFLLISFAVIIVIYIRIWYAICKWRTSKIGKTATVFVTNTSGRHNRCNEVYSKSGIFQSNEIETNTSGRRRFNRTEGDMKRRTNNARRSGRHAMRHKAVVKPVVILFAVSFLLIISYLPYFILMMLDHSHIVDSKSLPMGRRQLWELTHKSYFLGNVFNSIIYGVFDTRFRKRVFALLFRAGHYERVCCRT